MITLRFIEVGTDKRQEQDLNWYGPTIPRIGDYLRIPERGSQKPIKGLVCSVTWTGDGQADIRYSP